MLLFLIPVLVLSNEQSQGTEGIPAVCDTQTKKDMDIKSEEGLKFNEWIQKALAEAMADKDKQDTIVVPTPKQRPKKNYASKRPKKNYASKRPKKNYASKRPKKNYASNRPKKNYASAECVAKILAFNPESTNPKGLLNSNKDDYMLNPCKVKKWVVIELCEPIQAHSIDIASLELFSSQPKLFKIYLSDRYPPTKNWKFALETSLKDERVVQSFDLLTESHDYFAKFVKIELVDHFGDEHFCPLTILKVFGIAVTDYEDLNQEEPEQYNMDDDQVLGGDMEDSKNLFDSAREPQIADSRDSQNTDSVQINPCPTSTVFDSDIQESWKPDTKDVLETDTQSESETFIQADNKFTKVTDRQMIAILIGILIVVVISIIMSRWGRKESLSPKDKQLIESMPSKAPLHLMHRRNSISGLATPSKTYTSVMDSNYSLQSSLLILPSKWGRKELLSPEVKKLSGPATPLNKDTSVIDPGGTPNKFPSDTSLENVNGKLGNTDPPEYEDDATVSLLSKGPVKTIHIRSINRDDVSTPETGVNHPCTEERHLGSAAVPDLQSMQKKDKIHEIETMNMLLERLTERVSLLEKSLKLQNEIHEIEMDSMMRKLEVSHLGNSSELQCTISNNSSSHQNSGCLGADSKREKPPVSFSSIDHIKSIPPAPVLFREQPSINE